MKFIKGITFAPFSGRGAFTGQPVKDSFDRMIEGTGADFIILVPTGYQETPQSETICYTGDDNVSDEELIDLIRYAFTMDLFPIIQTNIRNTMSPGGMPWM